MGPFLSRAPINTPAGGSCAFQTLLLQSSPDALWKMNETSGSTAFDSIVGHHDAATVGTTPLWQQSLAPTGDYSPKFVSGPGPGFRVTGGFKTAWTPNLAGDFTAAVFTNRISNGSEQEYMGQGEAALLQPGWALNVSQNVQQFYTVEINNGGTEGLIRSDLPVDVGVWHWHVITHAGTLWTYYIDGTAQTATYSGGYVPAVSQGIWLGWDGVTNVFRGDFFESWGAVWSTRALSSVEIATIASAL